MNIKIGQNNKVPTESNLSKSSHIFILFNEKQKNPLFSKSLLASLKRQGGKVVDLKKTALSTELGKWKLSNMVNGF